MKRLLRANKYLRQAKEIQNSLRIFSNSPTRQLVECCKALSIRNVFDIGANVGQFGIDLRRNGFSGHIYSYEPVKQSFELLVKTSQKDQLWSVFPLALGRKKGTSIINVSANDGLSSSIMYMGKTHKDAFPESYFKYSEEIVVTTLEEEILKLGINPRETLVKMDVQGFERNVILGGKKSFAEFPLCYLEASILPLYEGEASFLELMNLLASLGHDLEDMFRGTKDRNNRLLQVDIITKSRSK